jgi:hypothetical protein
MTHILAVFICQTLQIDLTRAESPLLLLAGTLVKKFPKLPQNPDTTQTQSGTPAVQRNQKWV